jgi:hypothetical protein
MYMWRRGGETSSFGYQFVEIIAVERHMGAT